MAGLIIGLLYQNSVENRYIIYLEIKPRGYGVYLSVKENSFLLCWFFTMLKTNVEEITEKDIFNKVFVQISFWFRSECNIYADAMFGHFTFGSLDIFDLCNIRLVSR